MRHGVSAADIAVSRPDLRTGLGRLLVRHCAVLLLEPVGQFAEAVDPVLVGKGVRDVRGQLTLADALADRGEQLLRNGDRHPASLPATSGLGLSLIHI